MTAGESSEGAGRNLKWLCRSVSPPNVSANPRWIYHDGGNRLFLALFKGLEFLSGFFPPVPRETFIYIYTYIYSLLALSPSLLLQSLPRLLGRHAVTWLACCANGKSVVVSSAHGNEDGARLAVGVARFVVVRSLHVLSCVQVLVSGPRSCSCSCCNKHPKGMIHKGSDIASLCRFGHWCLLLTCVPEFNGFMKRMKTKEFHPINWKHCGEAEDGKHDMNPNCYCGQYTTSAKLKKKKKVFVHPYAKNVMILFFSQLFFVF